jgi:hypothetical protein
MTRTIILGRSGAGKTHQAIYLLGNMLEQVDKNQFHFILFSPNTTSSSNKRMSFLDPKIYKIIGTHYNKLSVETSLDAYKMVQTMKKKKKIPFLIFDDFGATGKAFWRKEIGNPLPGLFQAAPHEGVNILFIGQQWVHLPLDLRDSSEVTYIFPPENKKELEHIRNGYVGHLDKNEFIKKINLVWGNLAEPTPFKYLKVERGLGGAKKYFEGKAGEKETSVHFNLLKIK